MKRLAERVLSYVRPAKPRPIESTRDELAHAIQEHRNMSRRTTRLALLLADYRRADRKLHL